MANQLTNYERILIDKIKGCIFGAALGDAFGLATEFMTKDEARYYYGSGPIKFGLDDGIPFIRDSYRIGWQEDDFTDDTDQIIILINSILESNGILDPCNFARHLHEWTKDGLPGLNKNGGGIGLTLSECGTITHEQFLSDPLRVSYLVWEKSGRIIKETNGCVVRSSVLGIPFFWDEYKVAENSVLAAKVTQADPRSITAATILSVLISRILRGSFNNSNGSGGGAAPVNEGRIGRLLLKGSISCSSSSSGVGGSPESPPPTPISSILSPQSPQNRLASSQLLATFNRFKTAVEANEQSGGGGESPSSPAFQSCPPPPPPPYPLNLDGCGGDPVMTRLCRETVEDYKFMLRNNELCIGGVDWVAELEFYTSINSMEMLQYDENDIGYALKCLGYGLYCSSRAKPIGMSDSQFFKSVLLQLALEGGDADTNGAVTGAILGCRLGMSGLPLEWTVGLKNADYLNEIITKFVGFVIEQIRN